LKHGLILLAAGSSNRMGQDKMRMEFLSKTPLMHCLHEAKKMDPPFSRIVITIREGDGAEMERLKSSLAEEKNVRIIYGGCTRGGSVYLALKAMEGMDVVLIHDAARCLATVKLMERCYRSALERGSGIAALPARDTVFHREEGPLSRDKILLTQTPQAFRYGEIRRAYEYAAVTGMEATDDCGIYLQAGFQPSFVDGELSNQKLTYREDIPLFESLLRSREE